VLTLRVVRRYRARWRCCYENEILRVASWDCHPDAGATVVGSLLQPSSALRHHVVTAVDYYLLFRPIWLAGWPFIGILANFIRRRTWRDATWQLQATYHGRQVGNGLAPDPPDTWHLLWLGLYCSEGKFGRDWRNKTRRNNSIRIADSR